MGKLTAGAKLSAADKEQMKKLNAEEATLTAKFINQLVNAAKAGALHVEDAAALTGLSQPDKEAFAQDAAAKNRNGWLIPLQNTTQQPVLQSLSNRNTREQLFNASWMRAERSDSNDTRAGIIRIAAIRAQKAKLMGFENYAAWKLQDQMAQTPQAVNKFLNALVPAVTGKAKQEAADIQVLCGTGAQGKIRSG